MKKLLSSLALFTLIGSTAGSLTSSISASKSSETHQLTANKDVNDAVLEIAIKLIVQVCGQNPVDGSNLDSSQSHKHALVDIRLNLDHVLKEVAKLAKKILPPIGPLVAKLIESIVPERDCSICDDPDLPLKPGTNLVYVCLQIGGHVIDLDITVKDVKDCHC